MIPAKVMSINNAAVPGIQETGRVDYPLLADLGRSEGSIQAFQPNDRFRPKEDVHASI